MNLRTTPFAALIGTCLFLGTTRAEHVIVYRDNMTPTYRYWYDPVYVPAAQIYAHTDLVRSAAAVNYAEARAIHAQAVQQEIENSVARVKAYWHIKEIARAVKLRREISNIDRVKAANSKRWKIIESLPELSGPGVVESGNSLNFLLNRMDGTVLAYEFNRLSHQDDMSLREKLALAPEVVRGLRFREVRRGGNSYEFGADAGEALDVSWWPHALHADEFAQERKSLENARNRLAENAKSTRQVSQRDLAAVNAAMNALWSAVSAHFTRDVIFADIPTSFRRFREVELFLKALDCQIRRLEDTRDASAFDGRLRFDAARDGGDLISLLTFMVQNGLEFAPAKPGDEEAYHRVHRMMRDVYTLVADEDEGIKPQKTKEDTVSPDVLNFN
jgi:hypothetical protein